MRRAVVTAAALVCTAMIAPLAAPAAPAPYEISVIIPTTGTGAFLGSHEQTALGVLENVVNAKGGVRGRPVRFVIEDDATAPATSIQLLSGLIGKKVPVVIGSSVAATCSAMAPLVEKSGPVQYCLSPIFRGTPGGYAFSASAGSDSIAAVMLRFFREHGWNRIAIITATDASGVDFERQFDAVINSSEAKGMQVLLREHFNPSDISVSAQMTRIKNANPQALVTFATGTPVGTLLRGFHDAGMDIPIVASGGNMIHAQMAQYAAFVPRQLFFTATRGISPDPNLRPGPIKDAQEVYFRAFKAANIKPDFATSLAWDPTMIVIDALRKLGPDASAMQLHDYIQRLHGYGGIDGLYDFRDGSQRGIGQNAMQMYHWNPRSGEFEIASRAAGRLK